MNSLLKKGAVARLLLSKNSIALSFWDRETYWLDKIWLKEKLGGYCACGAPTLWLSFDDTVVILLILPVRKSWVVRLVRIVLLAGGIEWIRTLVVLAGMRQAAGAPWMRLALILGGVSLLTICSALVFRSGALRKRYNLSHPSQNKSE